MCHSDRVGGSGLVTVVVGFVLGGWDDPDGAEQPVVVEPGHLAHGFPLDPLRVARMGEAGRAQRNLKSHWSLCWQSP